jgi:hypothetical protein
MRCSMSRSMVPEARQSQSRERQTRELLTMSPALDEAGGRCGVIVAPESEEGEGRGVRGGNSARAIYDDHYT